jgi:hypothetical protein
MAYFTSSNNTENMSIRVNGTEKIGYYIKRPFIMMIGDVKAGDEISLHTTISNSNSGNITSYCAMFNDELFTQGYNKLAQSTLSATKLTDTCYEGDINVLEDGLFYTSISYNTGWKAYVDGKETEITPIGESELAFELNKGSHHIKLTYTPEGFVPGLLITLLAIALFIGLIFAVKFKDKIYAKVPVFGRIAAFATKERKGSSDNNSDKSEDISPDPEDEAPKDKPTAEKPTEDDIKADNPNGDAPAPDESDATEESAEDKDSDPDKESK